MESFFFCSCRKSIFRFVHTEIRSKCAFEAFMARTENRKRPIELNIINHFVCTHRHTFKCKQWQTFNFHLFFFCTGKCQIADVNCRPSPSIIMNVERSRFFSCFDFSHFHALVYTAVRFAAQLYLARWNCVCLQFCVVWRTECVRTFWHVYICVFSSYRSFACAVYFHSEYCIRILRSFIVFAGHTERPVAILRSG